MTKKDPLAATPAKMMPYVRALTRETRDRLIPALGQTVTASSLITTTELLLAQYDRTWTSIQKLQPVAHACADGCNYCCYLTVETTLPEIFLIADYVQKNRSHESLETLKARLHETAAKIENLSPEERASVKIPCALLENGRCSVYPVRPLGCRAWNSREVSVCASVHETGEGDLRRVQDQRMFGISAGVESGFREALKAKNLPEQGESGELNGSLLSVLESPKALEIWVAEEKIKPNEQNFTEI